MSSLSSCIESMLDIFLTDEEETRSLRKRVLQRILVILEIASREQLNKDDIPKKIVTKITHVLTKSNI